MEVEAKDVWFWAVRVVLTLTTGTFQIAPTVMAAIRFHCIGIAELSITLVSLWVSASAEVWLR